MADKPLRKAAPSGKPGRSKAPRAKAAVGGKADEALWRGTFDAVPDLLAVLDEDRKIVRMNQALLDRLGPEAQEALGRPCFEIFHGTDHPPENCPLEASCRDGRTHEGEVRAERLGLDLQVRGAPIRDAKGRIKGSIHMARDLTDRRMREGGLQHLNRVVQALSRSSQAMARAGDEASYLDEVCRIVVEDCGCFLVWIGFKVQDEARSILPMAWAGFEDGYLSTVRLTWADVDRGRGPTGTAARTGNAVLIRDIETDPRFAPWREEARARGYGSVLALPLLDGGEAFGVVTVYSEGHDAFSEAHVRILKELGDDLARGILTLRLRESERKAQEALRETTQTLKRLNDELEQRVQERTADLVKANQALTERILDRDRALEALKESEEKLRHAQKMEAIGTLAGGVAHDFNNLIQVINGYAEMTLDAMAEDNPQRGFLETIQRAGQKGAALTRQLLAFSRKQVLAPEILDLNVLFREMEKFFQRVVKEDVRLVYDLGADLGLVEADPSQMEQVIMNLVVNARDALPRGGTITVATRNLGASVAFTISDTGAGMEPRVLARIFEPFYTTKGVGRGTGLGLSTALGIVEQSGGTLEVRSRPGEGTTFTVTLPVVSSALAQTPETVEALPATGTETLLVAEDDEGVRSLTAHHLTAAGYKVLEAPDAAEALRLLDTLSEPVHLLLTDVVMPGMGGRELAEAVRARVPGIRVVFMSGYPDDALGAPEGGWADKVLISKPFDRNKLLRMVRKVLDGA